ncbi:Bifunctional xylanase/deacetylase precursor [compost metagenome]
MNNYIEYKRKVKVIDNTKPKLDVHIKDKYFMNQYFNKYDFTAIDNVDGDIKDNVETFGDVDTSKPGTYTIKYRVKDGSGNESEVEKKVIVDNKVGLICLTFDDGPSSNITPKVLDVLKEKDIKATFFLLNYNDDKIDIVKREINEGHSLGLHGYSHTYSEIYQSVDTARENIIKIQDRVRNTTGVNSKLIRFPGGSSNTISEKFDKGLMTRLIQEMSQEGFNYFDWNVSGEDAGSSKTSEDVYNNVMKGIKSGRTNVVLLHDFSSNKKMLEILPRIIDDAKNLGYDFEPITNQTDTIIHNVKN